MGCCQRDEQSKHLALIGDHKQLPPVIASRKAQAGGLGVSLFERLKKEKGMSQSGPINTNLKCRRSGAIDHARSAVPHAPVTVAVPVVRVLQLLAVRRNSGRHGTGPVDAAAATVETPAAAPRNGTPTVVDILGSHGKRGNEGPKSGEPQRSADRVCCH